MTWLSDSALSHLRDVADRPDFNATKYEAVEKLGEGGMASVFLARDRDRTVAIKVIHAPVIDPRIQERMLSEARIIARLEHPGILPVHDLGFLPDGRIYYVMKLVRGRRLDEYIEEMTSLPDRLRLFLRVCDAVAFAHSQGVIHRDLKPSNIMIGNFGEVLVIDWGLAKVMKMPLVSRDAVPNQPAAMQNIGPQRRTVHGDVLGTPGYMAPEQEHGDVDSIDERTDVYGLGALLRTLLTDTSPKAIQAVSGKAASPSPADRYSSVAELAQDVSCFLDGERVAAFPESLVDTGRRLVVRHRVFVVLIATYLAVRVVLLVVSR